MSDLFTIKVGDLEVLMIKCHWCGKEIVSTDKKVKHWATLYGSLFFCFDCVKDFVHKHG